MEFDGISAETPSQSRQLPSGSRDDESALASSIAASTATGSQRSLTHRLASGVRWTITDTGNRKVDMDIEDGERGLGARGLAPGIIHHGFPALLTSPIAFASFNRTFQRHGNHHPDRRRAQYRGPAGATRRVERARAGRREGQGHCAGAGRRHARTQAFRSAHLRHRPLQLPLRLSACRRKYSTRTTGFSRMRIS